MPPARIRTAITAVASIAISAQLNWSVWLVPEEVRRLINKPTAANTQNDVSANRPKTRAEGMGMEDNVTMAVPATSGITTITISERSLLDPVGDSLCNSQPTMKWIALTKTKPVMLAA